MEAYLPGCPTAAGLVLERAYDGRSQSNPPSRNLDVGWIAGRGGTGGTVMSEPVRDTLDLDG